MRQLLQSSDSFRKSLRFRLIISSVIVELVMLALMIGNNLREADHHLRALTEARTAEMTETFSIALGPMMAARDYGGLRSLAGHLAGLPDMVYLVVHDSQGHVLAAAGTPPDPLPPADLRVSAKAGIHHVQSMVTLYGQDYGHLRYGLSLETLRQAERALLTQGLLIALAEITLTVLALSTIAILLTRRLEHLTRASVRLAAGDYDAVVGIKGNDEVAALSAAFNAMSVAVREQFRRLEDNAVVLRRTNAELTRMAEVTAHHLQEPLRRMVSYSQLLRRRHRAKLPEEGVEFLDFIVEGATLMKKMLVDLQEYVAIDVSPPSDSDVISLKDCIDDAVAETQQRARSRSALIEVAAEAQVRGYRRQLVRVLAQLIDNALVHGAGGDPPRITISAVRSNGHYVVMVQDNGPGIPPEYANQAFELFTRLDTRAAGTGLGLAMVRKIVECHGGHVWLEPVLPQGLRVCFTVPAALRD